MIKSREGKDFPSTSDQLKRAIKHRLMHLGAGAEMNSALLQSNNADPDTIIQSLKEKGVINHLAKQIGPSRSLIAQELDSEPASISKDSGYITVLNPETRMNMDLRSIHLMQEVASSHQYPRGTCVYRVRVATGLSE